MLDFIKHINDNVSLSAAKKTAMLNDFCEQYSYQETIENPEGGDPIPNPVTKKEFANEKIARYIIGTVNAARLKAGRATIEIEELVLE